jgi:PRTRC genetic system protein C
MATIKMTRVFRFGASTLIDPDPELRPEQVFEHYAELYPQLRYGKVEEVGVEGDCLVFALKPAEYKKNG